MSPGLTQMPAIGEVHLPFLRGEGIGIRMSYTGEVVDAYEAEDAIKRLYEHIERLNSAWSEE